jgi:hypothetical protein
MQKFLPILSTQKPEKPEKFLVGLHVPRGPEPAQAFFKATLLQQLL